MLQKEYNPADFLVSIKWMFFMVSLSTHSSFRVDQNTCSRPSKEEIWQQFPEELCKIIDINRLKDAELLFFNYTRADGDAYYMHEFWHLKPEHFDNFAIGTVDGDPFFAYHIFCPEDGQHCTETIHRIKGLDGNEWFRNLWHWEKKKLCCTEKITTCDSGRIIGAPAEILPHRLDRTAGVFAGTHHIYQLTTRDSAQQRYPIVSQTVSNITSDVSIKISMVHTLSSQILSVSTGASSLRSKNIVTSSKASFRSREEQNLITRCAKCKIYEVELPGCKVLQMNSTSLIFQDPNQKKYVISEQGRFRLYKDADGSYGISFVGKHHHVSSSMEVELV